MKKVRYAIGMIGAAPALGLMIPTVAAASPHSPKPKAKTVNLLRSCIAHTERSKVSPGGSTSIHYFETNEGGGLTCIGFASGSTRNVVHSSDRLVIDFNHTHKSFRSPNDFGGINRTIRQSFRDVTNVCFQAWSSRVERTHICKQP